MSGPNMMVGRANDNIALAIGTIIETHQYEGVCRVRLQNGTILDRVRTASSNVSAAGIGVSAMPPARSEVIVVYNTHLLLDAYIIGSYTPMKPNEDVKTGFRPNDLFENEWSYNFMTGGRFLLSPDGRIYANAHPWSQWEMLPSDHSMRMMIRKFELVGAAFNVFRNINDLKEGHAFLELMVNERTKDRDDDPYPSIIWTLGDNTGRLTYPGNPKQPWLHFYQVEKRSPTDGSDIRYRYQERVAELIKKDGILTETSWLSFDEKASTKERHGVFKLSNDHSRPLLWQRVFHGDANEAYYEEIEQSGQSRRANPSWIEDIKDTAQYSLFERTGKATFAMNGQHGYLVNKSGSFFSIKRNEALVKAALRAEVSNNMAALILPGGPIAQLHNGAVALTLASGVILASGPIGAPAIQMGVSGPTPMTKSSTSVRTENDKHNKWQYPGKKEPIPVKHLQTEGTYYEGDLYPDAGAEGGAESELNESSGNKKNLAGIVPIIPEVPIDTPVLFPDGTVSGLPGSLGNGTAALAMDAGSMFIESRQEELKIGDVNYGLSPENFAKLGVLGASALVAVITGKDLEGEDVIARQILADEDVIMIGQEGKTRIEVTDDKISVYGPTNVELLDLVNLKSDEIRIDPDNDPSTNKIAQTHIKIEHPQIINVYDENGDVVKNLLLPYYKLHATLQTSTYIECNFGWTIWKNHYGQSIWMDGRTTNFVQIVSSTSTEDPRSLFRMEDGNIYMVPSNTSLARFNLTETRVQLLNHFTQINVDEDIITTKANNDGPEFVIRDSGGIHRFEVKDFPLVDFNNVTDLSASITGNINIQNTAGTIDIESSSGDVTIGTSTGDMYINLGSAAISGIANNLSLSTANGYTLNANGYSGATFQSTNAGVTLAGATTATVQATSGLASLTSLNGNANVNANSTTGTATIYGKNVTLDSNLGLITIDGYHIDINPDPTNGYIYLGPGISIHQDDLSGIGILSATTLQGSLNGSYLTGTVQGSLIGGSAINISGYGMTAASYTLASGGAWTSTGLTIAAGDSIAGVSGGSFSINTGATGTVATNVLTSNGVTSLGGTGTGITVTVNANGGVAGEKVARGNKAETCLSAIYDCLDDIYTKILETPHTSLSTLNTTKGDVASTNFGGNF